MSVSFCSVVLTNRFHSTDIELIPKCDAMKDDEVHAGPKSCLTIRTPKLKTATSRVDQTGDVAPVNFSSSTSHSSSSSTKLPVDQNASVVVPMEPEPVSVVVDEEDREISISA
uniref:Uncharacterized protein n=1 Tax=Panagrellus redivivus TaxID=6233 RepID=A0A7E4VMB7_PANRE